MQPRVVNKTSNLENSHFCSQILRIFENESSGWDQKFDGDNSVSGKPSKFKFQSENEDNHFENSCISFKNQLTTNYFGETRLLEGV